MGYTRRNFIKFGGLSLAMLPLLSNNGFGQTGFFAASSAAQDANSFQKLVGSKFTFYKEESSAIGVLKQVKISKPVGQTSESECFTLLFEMPSDDFVQENYEMFHPSIGKFNLLSVPGQSERGKPLLISVINRI